MALTVLTWNINSVRLRIDNLSPPRRRARSPTSSACRRPRRRTSFSRAKRSRRWAIATSHIHGMKGYNGVAILSRVPLDERARRELVRARGLPPCHRRAAGRHRAAQHLRPGRRRRAGPDENPKFAHKLRFLDELTRWFAGKRAAQKQMMLVGDLNIAPLETDVWSHKQLLTVVSHTPIEVEKLGRLQAAAEFVDAVRHFVPPEQRLYTWWSYRNRDWAASDRGRRLDHVWVTPGLQAPSRRRRGPSRAARLGQAVRPRPRHGPARRLRRALARAQVRRTIRLTAPAGSRRAR